MAFSIKAFGNDGRELEVVATVDGVIKIDTTSGGRINLWLTENKDGSIDVNATCAIAIVPHASNHFTLVDERRVDRVHGSEATGTS